MLFPFCTQLSVANAPTALVGLNFNELTFLRTAPSYAATLNCYLPAQLHACTRGGSASIVSEFVDCEQAEFCSGISIF